MFTSQNGKTWKFSTGGNAFGLVEGPVYTAEYHTAHFEKHFPDDDELLGGTKLVGWVRYAADKLEDIAAAHIGWEEPNWPMLLHWGVQYYSQTVMIGAPDPQFWKIKLILPNRYRAEVTSAIDNPYPGLSPAEYFYLSVYGNDGSPSFIFRHDQIANLDAITDRMKEGGRVRAFAYRLSTDHNWKVGV